MRDPSMKPHTKIALGVVGAVALVGVATSIAAAGERHGDGWHKGHRGHHYAAMVEKFDTNGDKAVTLEEAEAGRLKMFADADSNSSGSVTLDEFRIAWTQMMEQKVVRAFQRLDRDGDGAISDAEFERPVSRMFAKMDRNDDGQIDKSDRKRWWHFDDDDDDDDYDDDDDQSPSAG